MSKQPRRLLAGEALADIFLERPCSEYARVSRLQEI